MSEDNSKYVELGRKFYRAVQDEKIARNDTARKVAMYFSAFVGILIFIGLTLWMLQGALPK